MVIFLSFLLLIIFTKGFTKNYLVNDLFKNDFQIQDVFEKAHLIPYQAKRIFFNQNPNAHQIINVVRLLHAWYILYDCQC